MKIFLILNRREYEADKVLWMVGKNTEALY